MNNFNEEMLNETDEEFDLEEDLWQEPELWDEEEWIPEYDEEEELEDSGILEEEELTEAEEMEIVKLLQNAMDCQEKFLASMQKKILELNNTQEVEMREDYIEIEDGTVHKVVSAFLPDSENREYGWWVPMVSEEVEKKKKTKKVKVRKLPRFWEYIHKVPYSRNGRFRDAEDVRKERQKLKASIDYDLKCPMNMLEDVLDEIDVSSKALRGDKPTIPMDEFLADVPGRADSRQMEKIREYTKQWDVAVRSYHLEKNSSDTAYIVCAEKLDEIEKDMKKSITKMNRKTMSQMIKFAMGEGKSVGIPKALRKEYTKFGNKILKLCYDYNREMFLSCFKKHSDTEQEKIVQIETVKKEKKSKSTQNVRRSMKKSRKKAI